MICRAHFVLNECLRCGKIDIGLSNVIKVIRKDIERDMTDNLGKDSVVEPRCAH